MKLILNKFQDSLLAIGVGTLALSTLVFLFPEMLAIPEETKLGIFAFNFVFSIVYYFILLFNRKKKLAEHKSHYRFLLLMLFLVSAYSLNRLMEVFSASTTWVCVLLVMICVNYLVSIFFRELPRWAQYIVLFLLGVATIFFIYLAAYLVPLYAVSIPGLLAIGVSIHTFIPAFFVVSNFYYASEIAKTRKQIAGFVCGILAPVVIAVVYVITWSANVNKINKTYNLALASGTDQLPAWIQVSQYIPENDINAKILKAGLVYTVPDWTGNFLFRMPDNGLGEMQQYHDPLVVLASAFSGKVFLNDDEKINILKSKYPVRHHTEERLWSGEDLVTRNVITAVRMWPESHIAYTEKIITVYNYSTSRGWNGNQQEAIYSFHLPEGAVVTSLSLWINGKEEKSVLTTKEKAQNAYRAVVRVEVRDPSVVHWQEGNQVSVRVFPVAGNEQRIFKVGITSPLRKQGDQLVYDNIWFEGPDPSAATETVDLQINGKPAAMTQQASLKNMNKRFTRDGKYQQHWSYAIKDEGLAPQWFTFNGNRYFLTPYNPVYENVSLNNVYLDINSNWTQSEFNTVWNAVKDRNVMVYYLQPEKLTPENKDHYFRLLKEQEFSLFPVFAIQDPANSVLITKSGSISPDLTDLSGSGFLFTLKEYAKENHVRLFNLGHELSPYLASLKDYRLFNYDMGDADKLVSLIKKNQFVKDQETDNSIVIHNAQVAIVKQPGEGRSNGPDHLQRLFAYNHILKSYASNGFQSNAFDSSMITEAKEANVVSPVSSMIVLETQKDYERFDIKNEGKTLGNASLKNAAAGSSGAVPEPHEWVLIIMSAAVGLYLLLKSKLA